MKLALLLALLAPAAFAADAPAPQRFWYRFEVVGGKEYSGSSQLSENLIYVALRGDDFLRLEDVRLPKGSATPQGHLYLNPRHIIAVFPSHHP